MPKHAKTCQDLPLADRWPTDGRPFLETGKGLKKGPETILKISKMFQAFCSGLFPETGPKIKKNQPEIMNHQENLAKPSQIQ